MESREGRKVGAFGELALGIGLALATVAGVRAEPEVRIYARTRIAIEVTRDAGGFDLRGSLRDDAEAGLANRPLVLEIGESEAGGDVHSTALRTASDGRFAAAVELKQGAYHVRVRFEGDARYAASAAELPVDLTRAEVRLRFIEPATPTLDLDHAPHAISLRATSALGGAGLPIVLEDERGHALARGTTEGDGSFRAELTAKALGSPGNGSLRASTAGDGDRAPARAEIDVVKFRRTELTLQGHEARDGRTFSLEGRLASGGAPVAHKAVGLYRDDDHVATLLTDAGGAFRHPLPAPKSRDGGLREFRLQARFDSDAPWLLSSRSATLVWKPAGRPVPSALWLLVPLLVCIAVGIALLRGGTARKLAQQPVADRIGIHAGPNRSRGRAAMRNIGGHVYDASRRRPLPSARIVLQPTGAEARDALELRSDSRGRFESAAIADGHYRLTITVAGYAPLSSELSIPHRGEWSDMEVQLQSLRDAAVLAYKPAALRVLPAADLWQRWTPRETFDSATRAGRASESLQQLTERVERAAYARPAPGPEDVAAIAKGAADAIARFPDVPHASQSEVHESLRARIPHRR